MWYQQIPTTILFNQDAGQSTTRTLKVHYTVQVSICGGAQCIFKAKQTNNTERDSTHKILMDTRATKHYVKQLLLKIWSHYVAMHLYGVVPQKLYSAVWTINNKLLVQTGSNYGWRK